MAIIPPFIFDELSQTTPIDFNVTFPTCDAKNALKLSFSFFPVSHTSKGAFYFLPPHLNG